MINYNFATLNLKNHTESDFRVCVHKYVIVVNRYYDAGAVKLSMSVLKNNTTSVYTRDKVMCVKIYS